MLLSSVEGIDSRLEGTKNTLVNLEYGTIGALALSPYRYNMGTGIADAWRLLMQIEGTPCVTVQVGETAEISLDWALGGNSSWIRNCTVSISDEDSASLGLESAPVIEDGMLILHPTRLGSAKIAVEHIAGGDSAESVDSPSGMPVKRYVSVLARENVSENGGWL